MILGMGAILSGSGLKQDPCRTISIDFGGNGSPHYTGLNWNSIDSASPTTSGSNLIYTDNGANSGISLSFPLFDAGQVIDNGANYCLAPASGFPSYVHRYTIWGDPATINISGLNNLKKYDFKLLGTTNTVTHQVTITNGSQVSGWEAGKTCSAYGVLKNLVPSSGVVTVDVNFVTGTIILITAIIITEHN